MFINLSKLIKKYNLKITGVSHFGAHLGQEVPSYKENGIKFINLFEPQKAIFKNLKKLYADDKNVNLYSFGLGSENMNTLINLAPGNAGLSASILKPEKHKIYYPEINFFGSEEIEIKIYDELNIDNVNFLNIDIQGYELEALKGCINNLKKNIEYIYIEVSRVPLYEGSALISEIDKFLKSYNFIRIKTKWASSKIPWADAFYIKKNQVNNLLLLLNIIQNYFEKYNFYYKFIDPYRKFKKLIYKFKQFLKNLITKLISF